MDRPPTIEEVNAELQDLESRLKEYEELIERKRNLLEYRVLLGRLGFGNSKRLAENLEVPGTAPPVETSELAKRLLSIYPELSEMDMVREARRHGWTGSGDDAKDRGRFYAAMHRKKEIFEKVPDKPGTWRLKK